MEPATRQSARLNDQHMFTAFAISVAAWQAPECLLGLQASFPADIFSSGVILWELITGEQPVRGAYREPRYANAQMLIAQPDIAINCYAQTSSQLEVYHVITRLGLLLSA